MKVLDIASFKELNYIYITILVLLAVLIVLAITYFVFLYSDKHQSRLISEKTNTSRIFIVDVKNDCVQYFNTGRLKYRRSSSLTNFFSQFSSSERINLINWINALVAEKKDTKDYLEIETYIKKYKREVNSMLQVKKVDPKKQLVYLESFILSSNEKKKQKNRVDVIVSKDQFIQSFRDHKAKGTSYCLNLFNKNSKVDGIEHLSYLEIRNILSKLANEEIKIVAYDQSKFLISNYEISSKAESDQFLELLINKINSYLMIESLTEEIDFAFGCADNYYFYRDVKNLINTLSALAESAKDKNQRMISFDENSKGIGEDSSFKTEVENIIHDDKINYTYQILYDFSRNKIFGYYAHFECVDSIFKSIDELKNFAIRTDDDKKLFTTISKNSINNFINEKPLVNLKLFMNVNLNEIEYVNSVLTRIEDIGNANLTLVLSEREISTIIDDAEVFDALANKLLNIKSHGFEVALLIDDTILNLTPSLYTMFNYFILSIRSYLGSNISENIPVFKGLIEQLLKYKKTIIAIDIDTWDVVELVYKFGINILCGNGIATANENILPLDKKILARIKKMDA